QYYGGISKSVGSFYASGFWGRSTNYTIGTGDRRIYLTMDGWSAETSNSSSNGFNTSTSAGSWKQMHGVSRGYNDADSYVNLRGVWYGEDSYYMDDVYMFQLLDVGITATAATQANSSEVTGLRVDGIDTLSQGIGSSIANSRGVIKFELTPRHSFDIGASFGTTAPVVFEAYGDSDDYLKMSKVGGTMVTTISMAGTTAVANWSSPTLNAGTSYPLTISYETGGILAIDSNGARVASANIGAGTSFATTPSTIYFGSDNTGANQYDATFDNFEALTSAENTSAPYYKFGSKSVKLTHTSGSHADEYTTSISIGNTATHTLSAFVYDGTTGNIGGTVDNTIAQLSVGSTGIGTTYTDQGGGWWRLTGTVTGTGDTRSYGVQVKAGKTIYVDGVQLEQKSYSTTFADGSLGVGYSWASAENNSSSTRVGGNLQYSTDEIPTAEGTVSLWLKREYNSMVNGGWGVRSRYFSTNEDDDASNSLNISNHGGILHCGRNWDGGIELGAMPEIGDWHQVTVTWDNTAVKCYLDGVYKGEQSPVDISVEAVKVGWGQNWGYEPRSDGPVSDLRVYSSALTDAEGGDLYNAG
ncbi:MAG: hypothetical protein PHQ43_11695, partial [Dehalococcoidales bacterium]|nr:hypothetical protein [Dehalococcoidales bacterium]